MCAIALAVAAVGLILPQWAWGWSIPAGVLVQGVIVGSLTALLAFGLALIYRSNRIINFAQADLGAVPASLAVSLISLEAWSYWLAIPLALVASIALGAMVEFVIIRRFSNAPRLILMVVTIGLAQFLAGFGVAIPFFMGADIPKQTFPSPFDFSFEIPPVVFHANDLIAVITTVLVVVGLFLLMRFTNIGIALRASAESTDRASMLGVNVGFTHNVAWMITSFLAAVTLILRAGIIGLPLGSAFGPEILLRALTVAVIGRMENYAVMFLAACGLGAVEQVIYWNKGSPTLIDPVMFVIIIGALLLQRRRRESRVEDQATSSWLHATNVRPIPRELLRLPEVKWALRALRVAFVAFLVVLPFMLSERNTNLAAAVAIYAIIAISLVLLTGWAGEISLGQMAFVAIGSAAAGAANVHWHLDPALSFLFAGSIGAVAAVLIGLPALRIRGIFLAVTTLAFAVMTSSFLLNRDQGVLGIDFTYLPDPLLEPVTRFPQWTPFGHLAIGEAGAHPERQFYFVCIVALLLVIVAVRGLQRSRYARALLATRDNERGAQAFEVSPTRVKLLAFALSGFIASFAGGLLVLHQQALGEDIFAPVESIRALTMVVVGGLGSVPGAILGAVFLKSTEWFNSAVPERFRFLFTFAGSGIGLIIVLYLLPGGLGSVLYRVRDAWLRRVARRRALVVPSLIADSGDEALLLGGRSEQPAVAVANGERPEGEPRFLRLFPVRPAPDVDYFTYPNLRLSGGEPNLLSVRSIDVAYGQVQVLFGVSFEVKRGETIALLGTNGAGKSTVLRAISGLIPPKHGSIGHEGVDISGMAPHLIAARGIAHVPGGRGVFPSLTVGENLRVGLWLHRRDREYCRRATAEALQLFPALADRLGDPAAQLSGGQQQMLALAMAFLAKPDVLIIDELSLGLAPLVVAQLLDVVRRFREQGVTVILVEQSVNVALTIADKAYFMEKGAIRFHGLTSELLDRPDLLRSIFLEGSGASRDAEHTREVATTAPPLAGLTAHYERTGAVDESGGERRVVLATRGVTKRFEGVTAVDGVSFELHTGEILGIVGPNGAGKTTLFDLISGFLVPTEGTVLLEGHDITRWKPQRRARAGLARSFQDARLFGALTVHQTICVALDRPVRYWDPVSAMVYLPNAIVAERRLGARADELIEVLGLGDYRDKFVADLSTGSRRIVDLACQIGIDPKVILFDEPSSGIAQRETEALGPLLLRIRDVTGASLLVIEHDMPLITAVSDRMIACDTGRVIAEGDPDVVLRHPEVVASYLGSTRSVIERSGPAPASTHTAEASR